MKKEILQKWLESGPEELKDIGFFRIFKESQDSFYGDLRALFAEEKKELIGAGLVLEKDDHFVLSPEGVAFALGGSPKTKDEILVIQDKLKDKIEAWNFVAQKSDLPGIACAIVFGSVAEKPHQEFFGDLDVALLWRRKNVPRPLSKPSNPSICGAHAVLASLGDQSGPWEVEDAVEMWLSATGVSLGSVDQLASLSDMGGVRAWYPLFEDSLFDLDPQEGVRQDEQNVVKSIQAVKSSHKSNLLISKI
mgnify:CR=1 FL=1